MRKFVPGAAAAAAGLAATAVAVAQINSGVPAANGSAGTPANVLASGYTAKVIADGPNPLENPTSIYQSYGYLNDKPDPLARTRTEPDQNTYLNWPGDIGGPTPGYDYGHHFLVQGHENGSNKAYLTRINLDVTDPAHRITLLSTGVNGNGETGLSSIDGSTYDPFNGKLLFSSEAGGSGGVVQTAARWTGADAPPVEFLNGSIGRGGYEGLNVDANGNVYVVEDAGGAKVADNGTPTSVKQPNSFVYRFKPSSRGDLRHGVLQGLQIAVDGKPMAFHPAATDPAAARDDAFGEAIRRLHSGETLQAKWITLHDTEADGTASFDANALAKAKGATPLKRPENGKFVPGTDFASWVFDETGDTDKPAGDYPGAADRGAWGALLRLDMPQSNADTGTVKTIVLGDATHNSFDNVQFLDRHTVLAAEDRGDTLHNQAGVLDSVWSYDLDKSYGQANADARRLMALGRDTIAGQTKEDNEPTGVFVSDGSISQGGLLGAQDPAEQDGVRMFFTQQHGSNTTFEITGPKQDEGQKGPQGDQGQKGPDGDKGQSGDKGPRGEAGLVGAQGAAGPQGPVGPKGLAGTVTIHVLFDNLPGGAAAVRAKVASAGSLAAELRTVRGGRRVALASGRGAVTQAGAVTLRLRRSAGAAARRLRGKRVKATLAVTFRPQTGGRKATYTKRVTVRP